MQQQRRRSGIILGLLAIGLLAGVAMTANPAQAANITGPYYAEPAWDQKFEPAKRFGVLTDWNSEAVLDKETGLVWQRSPDPTLATWSAARIECTTRTTGNRKGWRLPSVHELGNLIHPSVAPGPTLQPGHPFLNVQPARYWSATTDAVFPTNAWSVNFFSGDVNYFGDKTGSGQVWCVRGGMQADQY